MTLAALVQTAVSLLPALPALPALPTDLASARHPAASTAVLDVRPVVKPPLGGTLTVLDPFRPPAHVWLPGHRGVDLAAFPGEQVLASGAGLVLWAGDLAGRGVVSVRHGDGWRTTYEPVTPAVEIGDLVAAGDLVGWLAPGVSHCGGVPTCLHWGLRRDDDYLDPLRLLPRAGRPRLLPLGRSAP